MWEALFKIIQKQGDQISKDSECGQGEGASGLHYVSTGQHHPRRHRARGSFRDKNLSFRLAKGTDTGGRAGFRADGQQPSSARSQTFFCTSGGKTNAGFGKNVGTLVALAEPPTQGKQNSSRSDWKGAGRDPSHLRGQLLLWVTTPQKLLTESVGASTCVLPRQLCRRTGIASPAAPGPCHWVEEERCETERGTIS